MSLTEILLSLVLIGVLAAFFVPKVLRATNDLFDAEYYVTGQKIAEFLNDAREHYGLLRQSMGPQRMSTSLGQVEGITERFDVLTGDHLNSSPMPPAAGEILYAGNASAGITPGAVDGGGCFTQGHASLGHITVHEKGAPKVFIANWPPDWPYQDTSVSPTDCAIVLCVYMVDGNNNIVDWGLFYARRRTTFAQLVDKTWPVGVSTTRGTNGCDYEAPPPTCSPGSGLCGGGL
ncbi:MAG: hypothetical protein KC474_10090 [Cyanobacteria bacterium HKST-UBA04]|nr:hypothetical protein [Cyanobacteria bacterium HKST-UBA05]MCA9799889.1 hypothetical protein [Cyanobacteria bacterium HKST-UBA04]MCA9840559.1 hypothetical protein [Cyanobacteria bacterium HKST-UBA03]